MSSSMQTLSNETLASNFRRLGIDPSRPGFCDDPAFLRAEEQNPRLLQLYGAYVRSLSHSREYLDRARVVIGKAADFLLHRLVADGRRGACVDVTHTLSRLLNRQGVWNFAFNGGATITFARRLGVSPIWMQPIATPDGRAGHVWLCAAPFQVVDITIQMQPYHQGESEHVPPHVLAESLAPATPTVLDLVDSDALRLTNGRLPTLREVATQVPYLLEDLAMFPAGKLAAGSVEILYAPWQVHGMTGTLEEMRNLCLSGKYPLDLCREFEAELQATAPTGS